MKVVILCGGKGTRIRDVSELLPKPMLPIGSKPVLWHIMKGFAAQGHNEFVLCLGYKGWLIKEFFLNYHAMTADLTIEVARPERTTFHSPCEDDWTVTLAETGEESMTGARVARVRRYLEAEDLFILTYGDSVSDVDLGKLIAFHRAHGRIATVTAVRPRSRFGELQMDGDRVARFDEKPLATAGFINGGFFVCDAKRIWKYLSTDPALTFEREPLQRLAEDGELFAYSHSGFWHPMDTQREYNLLNDLWASGEAPWKTWR